MVDNQTYLISKLFEIQNMYNTVYTESCTVEDTQYTYIVPWLQVSTSAQGLNMVSTEKLFSKSWLVCDPLQEYDRTSCRPSDLVRIQWQPLRRGLAEFGINWYHFGL